jgi:ATP-dependent RNA helicase DeaD
MTSTHESLSSSVDLIASVASPSQLDTLQTHRISTSLLQNHQEEAILDVEGLMDNQETAQIRLDEYQGKEVENKGTQDKEVAIHPEGVIAQDQAAPEGLIETSMLTEQEKTEDTQAEKSVDNTGKFQIVEAESFTEVIGSEIDSTDIDGNDIDGDNIDGDEIDINVSAELTEQPIPAEVAPPANGFGNFGFCPEILTAIESMGYSEPSPIQKAAIPELMLGRDVLGQAQTGTGKTAAFGLPLLAAIDPDLRHPQVLVLAPTRELAMQVAESFNSYAAHMPRVKVLAIYGGADFRDQIHHLRRGVQIVVGTPGRVMDHMRQGTLDLSNLRTLVLDEADEMLRMGFIDDVEWVLNQLPEQRQVVLFSATMPTEIRRISQKYLNSPAEVTIRQKGDDSSRIRQRYLTVHGPQKLAALERVLEAEGSEGVIIFARTKAITLTVAESLEAHGYDVAVLNGDVPQAQRERTIERLRSGKVNVLVATDVAARGLDVERIGLVINYDIPFDAEAYVHRIGRTGRAGRTGDAILFLTPRERRFLSGLERAVARPIEPMEVPSNATINQHRLDRLRLRLTAQLQSQLGVVSNSETELTAKSSANLTSKEATKDSENDLAAESTKTIDKSTSNSTSKTPNFSVSAASMPSQERVLLAEILQRVAGEQSCTAEQLALAAIELTLAGKPLLLQGEESWNQGRSTAVGRDGDRSDGRRPREANREPGRLMMDGRGPRGERPPGPPEGHMERFRVEVGWRDRIKPGNIVGAIANEAGLNGKAIGRIQIFDTHSTVDLPKGMPEDVFQGLRQLRIMNKPLQISRIKD